MKTIDLATVEQPVEELLELAENDDLLIKLPDGKAFLITAVTKTDESDADFADEVARTRKNAALMALLEDRSTETVRISSEEARRRLGIE